MPDRVNTTCPCCKTKLVIDAESGDVLSEERPRITDRMDFDDAISEVHAGTGKREAAFEKAFDRTQRQEDLLAKKFEEARKKAAKDKSEKPFSPFDLD